MLCALPVLMMMSREGHKMQQSGYQPTTKLDTSKPPRDGSAVPSTPKIFRPESYSYRVPQSTPSMVPMSWEGRPKWEEPKIINVTQFKAWFSRYRLCTEDCIPAILIEKIQNLR